MKKNLPVIFLTFANDKVDDAMYLRNLPLELHNIRTALDKAVKAGLCEVVERTAATVDDIFNTFQDPYYQDRIAVFHYGGHASGSQLMLETLDGNHGHSYSDGLVPFLAKQKGLKVAFFNGCSSQEQATDLSEAGVPAVIGTATAINDSIATELAGRFYNGLASGQNFYESWLEAIDIVKTKNSTKKRKGLKLRRDKTNDFPWQLLIREGAEIVKEWNLPSAANNPYFGLPELPKLDLPEQPFRFLRRYEPNHTEIFFGRGKYIRQLYDRITSEKASPVILFYGQSGAGKSSTLASGLLPHLEQEADVKYLRRNEEIGLLRTLDIALGGDFESAIIKGAGGNNLLVGDIQSQIQQLEQISYNLEENEQTKLEAAIHVLKEKLKNKQIDIDTDNATSRLEKWLSIEKETGRPFHILLDQVEETFTRPNPKIEHELEQLLTEIQVIFSNPNQRPHGKIILSYRKEYNPEIEETCKKLQIPREKIFLKKLDKSDIEAVVNGVASTDRLKQKYNISVEENLPAIIADDLLEDKDSPIAPVLSILLTKLWELSNKEADDEFTIKQYQELKIQGILMDDFFKQQMEKLKNWKPEFEESGLALDVLNFHTTKFGTAGSQSKERIKERYKHQEESINPLLQKFQDLFLLSSISNTHTGLAHDTLAPIVKNELRSSDKTGQRAFRILTSKAHDFQEDKTMLLDSADLSIVEKGKEGMRLWTDVEEELIINSKKRRSRQKALRRNLIILGLVAITSILGLSVWSYQKTQQANASDAAAQAITAYGEKDYTKSKLFAQEAFELDKRNPDAYNILLNSKYNNIYQIDDNYYTTPFEIPLFSDLERIKIAKNDNMVVGESIDEENIQLFYGRINGKKLFKVDLDDNEELVNYEISPKGDFIATTSIVYKDSIMNASLWKLNLNDETAERIHTEKRRFNTNYLNNTNLEDLGYSIGFSPRSQYFYCGNQDFKSPKATVVDLASSETMQLKGDIHIRKKDMIVSRAYGGNIFSDDEQYIVTNYGKIYDLKNRGELFKEVNFSSEFTYRDPNFPLNAYFIQNSSQVVVCQPAMFVIKYDIKLDQIIDTKQIYGKYTIITGFFEEDGMYIEAEYDDSYRDYNNFTMSKSPSSDPILVGDGYLVGIYPNHKFLITNSNDNTRIYGYQNDELKPKPSSLKGDFVGISDDGKYIFTQFENKYCYVWSNQNIPDESQKLLTILHGEFYSMSKDHRFVSTSTGLYDLQSEYYPVAITSSDSLGSFFENFFSEDGKYLIEDNEKSFVLIDSRSGKLVKNVDLDNYKKNTWLPYKKEYIKRSKRVDSRIVSRVPLETGISKNGFYEIYMDNHRLILSDALNIRKTKIAEFDIIGREVYDYYFKNNDTMIEVISIDYEGLDSPYADTYIQQFWLSEDDLY